MKVVTPTQMRTIDDTAINDIGMPSLVLMENAGASIASVVEEVQPDYVVVLVGKGNNGGDGLVAARHLCEEGFDVSVVVFTDAQLLSKDAKVNYDLLTSYPVDIWHFDDDWERFDETVISADVVIDALLGTGAAGGLRGDFAKVANVVSALEVFTVAADVPSGIDAATGAFTDVAMRADVTVTMGLIKSGMLVFPARAFVGDIIVADIGFPRHLIESLSYNVNGDGLGYVASITEDDEVDQLLPDIEINAHKGSQGKGLLIAGSRGMSGAAVLAANSALCSGIGLCYAGVPISEDGIVNANCIEAITIPLPDKYGYITADGETELKRYIEECNGYCIGPGLGRHSSTTELLERLVEQLKSPAIIDADGLYHLGLDGLRGIGEGIITPHPGEMARLFDVSVEVVQADRIGYANRAATETGLTVILKGYLSVIASPDEPPRLNPTGNPGMATAGSGDVLSGVLLALLCQGISPFDAAILGTYVHGLAGDLAADRYGEISVTAGAILEMLPEAWKALYNGENDAER